MFLAQAAHESVGLTTCKEFASGAECRSAGCPASRRLFPGRRRQVQGDAATPRRAAGTNYTGDAGRALGLDVVDHPEFGESSPRSPSAPGRRFWKTDGAEARWPTPADFTQARSARIVDGGRNGAADGVMYFGRAKKALGL